jgi:hypothetical protein
MLFQEIIAVYNQNCTEPIFAKCSYLLKKNAVYIDTTSFKRLRGYTDWQWWSHKTHFPFKGILAKNAFSHSDAVLRSCRMYWMSSSSLPATCHHTKCLLCDPWKSRSTMLWPSIMIVHQHHCTLEAYLCLGSLLCTYGCISMILEFSSALLSLFHLT